MERNVVSSADGIPIQFDAVGSGGPPIVFVHGWSCDRTYWRNQMSWFARSRRAVVIDLAGHGESGPGDGRGIGRTAWTMPAFGEDVAAVVRTLDLRDAILVGHSMGGDVIVEAGLRLPDRVAGLVWIDTYGTLGNPSPREANEAFIAPFRRDFAGSTKAFVRRLFLPGSDPALVDLVASDMASAPPEIAIDAMRHSIGNAGPIVEALRVLGKPVAAITPDRGSTDVAALGRHGVSPVVLMPGVGHFPMLEDPDRFNELLDATIRQLRTPVSS